ncbi:MAG TPA: sigma-70 family RNA polymerase sigma factor [Candidatus Limnocylindria bacterium]|nr:sigma-70 family RNA polymerase sigma factor [Candidatus Limnocylindria bacterium]
MDIQPGDERIIAHLGFARAVASRALDPRCRGADREDLVAWGVVGLVQAARRYRNDHGAPFSAYAARRVRGQVLDALRERDPLTRSARRAYREARELDADLPPPIVEVSLDRCVAAGIEGPEWRAAGAGAAVPGHARCRDRRWPNVARELRHIDPRERKVLVLSFARGLTLKEIGAQIGLSESGVCRLRARALRRVRARCA